MTVEHRLVFGLDDIIAVTFECRRCKVRLSIVPEKIDTIKLQNCPTCQLEWLNLLSNVVRDLPLAPLPRLVAMVGPAVSATKDDKEKTGVVIRFEFAEPKP